MAVPPPEGSARIRELERWTPSLAALGAAGRRARRLARDGPDRDLSRDRGVGALGAALDGGVLVARGGVRMLFDCGEGTQRQMQRSLGLIQVDEIYLTHFHADHVLGMPGLLKTYDLTDREAPLTIYGPPGLGELFQVFRPLLGRLGFALELVELRAGETASATTSSRCGLRGRAPQLARLGYALVEDERPGRFDPAAAKAAGVPEGPAFAALQRGEEVEGSAGTVAPEQVMGPTARAARRPHRRHRALAGDRRRRRRRRAADP